MADNCSKLMKEALDNYLGIDMRYKLDDTLVALGKQKLNATQLEGYLLKQGVSPKEIKQSGIFEGMTDDNRAISAEDWLSMSGNQRVNTFRVAPEDAQFDAITLDKKGVGDDSKYREILSTVKKPKNNVPYEPHFEEEMSPKESLLGWRRTHVDEIDGKKTLVLNEFQSDWAQTERAKRGTFESSADPSEAKNKKLIADFPMSEIKHHQFQIVGAIDDALKQGIDTIVIPIQRENELHGSPGVTKFYESLNQKVLPDIRKKLEKQGMRIKVDKTPYNKREKFLDLDPSLLRDMDNTLRVDFQNFDAGEAIDSLRQIQSKPWFKDFKQSRFWPFNIALADHPGVMEVPNEVVNDVYAGLYRFYRYENQNEVIKKLLLEEYDRLTPEAKNEMPVEELLASENIHTMLEKITNVNNSFANPISLDPELLEAIRDTKPTDLWRLTVEEIPNKKVNWDVYGLIGALGLSQYAKEGEDNASRNIE